MSFTVAPSLSDELELVATVTQDFVTDFLPGFVYLITFLFIAVLLTSFIVRCCGFALRSCRAPANYTQLSQIVLGTLLLFAGVSLAFGYVGISFTALFIGWGFITGGLVYSMANYTNDFVTGIQLHTFSLLNNHSNVSLKNGPSGKLRAIGLFTSELVKDDATDAAGAEKGTHVMTTVLIPNRRLLDDELTVTWTESRSKAAGSIDTGRSDARRNDFERSNVAAAASSNPASIVYGPTSSIARPRPALKIGFKGV